MLLSSNEKIVTIIERTLNLVDNRLVDHGKRVAYRVFRKLYPLASYSQKELRDICMLALLHDIGAYKTEDINNIVSFDTEHTWSHSIYGYLFLRNFSPLRKLAPVVLFHHAKPHEMDSLDEEQKRLSLLLRDCDVFDIRTCIGDSSKSDISPDEDPNFAELFSSTPYSDEEIECYINMIVYCIDFRSSQTLLHTFAASFVAKALATLAGFEGTHIQNTKAGAMLHDIGKMGTPLHILESTSGVLTTADMEIMKNHILDSRQVLEGCVTDEVFGIAVNHHERLNGKGYPNKLGDGDLKPLEKLMAVADLFSALCVSRSYQKAKPKEQALHILGNMKTHKLLDDRYIDLAMAHYDELTLALNKQSEPVVKAYEDIKNEFFLLNSRFARGVFNFET